MNRLLFLAARVVIPMFVGAFLFYLGRVTQEQVTARADTRVDSQLAIARETAEAISKGRCIFIGPPVPPAATLTQSRIRGETP